ncbi:MAG: hypothetical protein R6W68_04075 [Ignavibacteriaceae bacterium]
MKEIFYAIYKKVTIDVLIKTLLAESILSGNIKYFSNRIEIPQESNLSDEEKNILKKIKFGRISKIKLKNINKLKEYYLNICLTEGYLKKSFIFGFKKTRKFTEEIEKHISIGFNEEIKKYIDTKDQRYLIKIMPEIDMINFAKLTYRESQRIGLYRDMLAMQRAAIDHRFGRAHPPPGS